MAGGETVLAGLDETPWPELSHAYGAATDVPARLRDLASGDSRRTGRALQSLASTIYHQGTCYDATAVAVPFLRRLAADPATVGRERLLGLLRSIAEDESYRIRGAPFVPAPGSEEERLERDVRAARRAVADGLDEYVAMLDGDDRRIRVAAAHLLAVLADRAPEVVPALLARVDERDARVRCGIVLALGDLAERVPSQAGSVEPVLSALLEHADASTRAAAGVALRWQSAGRLLPARAMAVLLDAYGRKLPALASAPWANGDAEGLLSEAMGIAVEDNVPIIEMARRAATPAVRGLAVRRGATLMHYWRDAPEIVVPLLALLLADDDPDLRVRTLHAIASTGRSAAGPVLDQVAAMVTAAAQRVPLDEPPVPGRQPWDMSPHEAIMVHGLDLLGRHGDSRCLDPLVRVLHSGAVTVKVRPILAGMADHAERLMPTVLAILARSRESPRRRGMAQDTMHALVGWGQVAAATIEPLLALLTEDLGTRVVETLAAVTPPGHPAAAEVSARLAALFDPPGHYAHSALEAYRRLTGDNERVLAVTRRMVHDGDLPFRVLAGLGPFAAPLLPSVRPALTDLHMRTEAAEAVWRLGGTPDEVVPPLLEEMRRLRLDAVRVLGAIGPPAGAAAPFLRDVRDRRRRMFTNGYSNDIDNDEQWQRAAAEALAALAPDRTVRKA
jgi:hypothetical protein